MAKNPYEQLLKKIEKAIKFGLRDTARFCQRELMKAGKNSFAEYYAGYYPRFYDRTEILTGSLEELPMSTSATSVSVGIQFNSGLISYPRNKSGYPDSNFVIGNFLEGKHHLGHDNMYATGTNTTNELTNFINGTLGPMAMKKFSEYVFARLGV